jgi:hypothetical protein
MRLGGAFHTSGPIEQGEESMGLEYLYSPSPKAPDSRFGGADAKNSHPPAVPKFVFPSLRPNSSPGVSRPTSIYRGPSGGSDGARKCHRLALSATRAKKKPKHFPPSRPATTVAAANTPRRDGPLSPVVPTSPPRTLRRKTLPPHRPFPQLPFTRSYHRRYLRPHRVPTLHARCSAIGQGDGLGRRGCHGRAHG